MASEVILRNLKISMNINSDFEDWMRFYVREPYPLSLKNGCRNKTESTHFSEIMMPLSRQRSEKMGGAIANFIQFFRGHFVEIFEDKTHSPLRLQFGAMAV
jgi:hypothetical protein